MRPLAQSSAADWVAAGTDHWKLTVKGFVPAQYEAFARVLHEVQHGDDHETWASVAAANGQPFGPLAQWTRINVNPEGEEWSGQPRVGTLTPHTARSLSESLAPFTTTPEACFFGVWEGFGGSELPPACSSSSRNAESWASSKVRSRMRRTRSLGPASNSRIFGGRRIAPGSSCPRSTTTARSSPEAGRASTRYWKRRASRC